jgi:transglutaminase-like putative cysteine protease
VTPTNKFTDLGLNTLIPLNRGIDQPYDTIRAVYRITLKDDANPETAFATDDRQEIKNVKDSSFELHVKAIKKPGVRDDKLEIGRQFLASCYFLDCDNPKIKALASEAIGDEADPWHKAKLVESWVYQNVASDNSIPFCPASQVAGKLKGDCRQHSMLAAAMCRAADVPSQTAVGLIYIEDRKKGPVMGFHMWAEVWVKGQWISIDPTFGPGKVGATHLKISDHSWNETQSLTPLLPVARVLGKLKIEVVSVDGSGK